MEQILDDFIAVALVFLLLSLIVKGVQDVLKHVLNNKENAMTEMLIKFLGREVKEGLSEALKTVFGQKHVGVLERFNVDQFREILDKADGQKLDNALCANLKEPDVNRAKELAVGQFTNAVNGFQKLYGQKMGATVFLLSLAVVLLLNANIVSIYEEIRANSVTRTALVKIADQKYSTTLEVTEGDSDEDVSAALQEDRDKIKDYLTDAPIIMRGVIGGNYHLYVTDFERHPFIMIFGLLFSAFLVYLGAPFWHDLLQSLLSAKNILKRKE
jgi:hypothetical protein